MKLYSAAMAWHIVDAGLVTMAIVTAPATIAPVSIIRRIFVSVYWHESVVIPPFKAFAMLDPRCFVVRVTHGEKYGGFAHALGNLSMADQLLMFAAEGTK